MALIHCPECNKEISDTADLCPNCGFALKKESTRTQLGPVETSSIGIFYILIGAICVITGIFTIAIIIGIFMIIGGVACISVGAKKISGTQNGICPYCRSNIIVPVKDTTASCPKCKKVSRKNGNCLEKIN